MQPQVGHTQTLRAQFWIKSPLMDIDTLAERERARGNTVLEIHKDCNCIGAGNNNGDDITSDRDNHLLVLDAERVQ